MLQTWRPCLPFGALHQTWRTKPTFRNSTHSRKQVNRQHFMYLPTSSGSSPSIISALPPISCVKPCIKHVQTLGRHYSYNPNGSHSLKAQWYKPNFLSAASVVLHKLSSVESSSQKNLIVCFPAHYTFPQWTPSWVPPMLLAHGCFPQDQMDIQTSKIEEIWDT